MTTPSDTDRPVEDLKTHFSSSHPMAIVYVTTLICIAAVVIAISDTCFNNASSFSYDPFAYFPRLGAAGPDIFPMPPCYGVVLEEATIDQLQNAMATGQLSSERLVMCYLWRIEQTDKYIKYAI
jgi:amidase